MYGWRTSKRMSRSHLVCSTWPFSVTKLFFNTYELYNTIIGALLEAIKTEYLLSWRIFCLHQAEFSSSPTSPLIVVFVTRFGWTGQKHTLYSTFPKAPFPTIFNKWKSFTVIFSPAPDGPKPFPLGDKSSSAVDRVNMRDQNPNEQ